ncbi:hypothetical protein HOD38_05940 [archaeon]|jgi:hypothetical protein|nr:hypothetical protein [archaeon]MBT4397779.1 hypothetical protein [archaeon]MBT4441113.1 hypothetical protein [archaeon]
MNDRRLIFTITMLPEILTEAEQNSTFEIPEADRELILGQDHRTLLAYLSIQVPRGDSRTYQHFSDSLTREQVEFLESLRERTSSGYYKLDVNGRNVELDAKVAEHLEERLVCDAEAIYAVSPVDGREHPLMYPGEVPVQEKILGGERVEGVVVQDEFWPIKRKQYSLVRTEFDVSDEEINRFEPFLYSEIKVARKSFSEVMGEQR